KGVVLVHDRHAEHGHHRVADELLDHAAVALDDNPRRLVIARKHSAEGLRIEPLAHGGGIGKVAEEDGDPPARLSIRREERRGAGQAETGMLRVLLAAIGTGPHWPSVAASKAYSQAAGEDRRLSRRRPAGQVAIPIELVFANEAHQLDLVLRQLRRASGVLDLRSDVFRDRGSRELSQPVSDSTGHTRRLTTDVGVWPRLRACAASRLSRRPRSARVRSP